MPYKLKGNCVYNSATGEKKGCSDNRAMAVKHMRALYAAESGSLKKDAEQDELDDFLVNNEFCTCEQCQGDVIKAFNDKQDSLNNNLIDRIKAFFVKPEPEVIQVIKQDDGRTRVLLRVSNIFKDRHGEIITSEAHENYVAYVNEKKDYPEFWLWHTPGTRWGQADLVYFDNGFLTMSGLVDQGKEHIADGLAANSKELGVSHGFRGLKLHDKGYIDYYRSFEASPLPRSEAANLWTGVLLAKEASVGIDQKHRDFFKLVGVPDETVTEWDAQNKSIGDMLKEAGILYKANTEPEPPEPESEPEPQPTIKDVLQAVTGLSSKIEALEIKQKELESKVDDPIAYVMEAAVKQGPIGDPATKANDNTPNNSNNTQSDEEFAQLFLGSGAR